MIKKIRIDQLTPGMYIHDLNLAWFDHPFVRNQFLLDSDADLQRIVATGVQSLYIDAARGRDVDDAPTLEEAEAATEASLLAALAEPAKPAPLSRREEMSRASRIHQQAGQMVRQVMSDVRMGRAIEVAQAEEVAELIADSIDRNAGALIGLIGIKNKDEYTFLHSVAVGTLMITFAKSLGLSAQEVRQGGVGGLLHDTGKMLVPDHILNKPGRLTDEEFAVMRSHPLEGWKILKQVEGIDPVALEITLLHHERQDGSGYPEKRKADQLSQMVQMASIVDVYDAITSDRCYHKGMPAPQVLRKLWEWSPHHFNPQLVQAFIRTIGIYPVGTLVKLQSGRLAVVTEQNDAAPLTPLVKVIYSTKTPGYLPPEDLDLALAAKQGGDRIAGFESPEKYGIDVGRFLLAA
ncbi:HD-GYP domain, c-di-GMP phosphodiesterase class II (or its inactivated variant) [Andreprevotia lacus DSM 23236]|jgi:HD-GYP domain-containing protein (c-di-GMP phosphodiesterase class II)|uniref:HD-GYP domain, c-di-GMP phosphodiesterase class II (Or its inactivated variant) n=1 Tax=Andreprevotia lacus DSM 23236 TaxID=1121001 RepID=A0A1W1XRU6_9NEIS|nr:HD-GYP domain-containing protein [Andreprevotia lacus]SMC26616.1 HD-GYP domain, c-di-GMP phosphodiesterase class II (or its inactivated variant) [Andreprevotia lacus DSM 23236]